MELTRSMLVATGKNTMLKKNENNKATNEDNRYHWKSKETEVELGKALMQTQARWAKIISEWFQRRKIKKKT